VRGRAQEEGLREGADEQATNPFHCNHPPHRRGPDDGKPQRRPREEEKSHWLGAEGSADGSADAAPAAPQTVRKDRTMSSRTDVAAPSNRSVMG